MGLGRAIALVALVALAGCAERWRYALVPEATGIGATETVLFATSRPSFAAGRSPDLAFGLVDVSIPPRREPGEVETPEGRPDPRTEFVASAQTAYPGEAAFRDAVAAALRERPHGEREVVLYVHGYNTTLTEGLYRLAQLGRDLGLGGVSVLYDWPSAASPLAYLHDRDAALFARDGLERSLALLEAAGAERVILVAHSLGALLAMEALRQDAIADGRLGDALGAVVLIAPDIGVPVFHAQAERIGRLPQPFLIIVSERDWTLRLSELASGEPARLGNIEETGALSSLDVTVVDVTAFEGDPSGHFLAARSPALLRILERLSTIEATYGSLGASPVGLLPGAVLTIRNATEVVLTPARAVP